VKNKALNITGEDVNKGHFGTESRLLNAYGSPVVVRVQNENRAAARGEEDVSESRSVVGTEPLDSVMEKFYTS